MFERHGFYTPRQSLMDAPLRLPIGTVIHPDEDPNVQFVCPKCNFVLRVYGPPLEGDLFDRMQQHDCGGGVA